MPPKPFVFRKMTRDEFSKYRKLSLERYAQDIARNFSRPIDEVRTEAKQQVRRILRNGLSTPGHFLYNVLEKKTGETIGLIWFNVDADKKRVFLNDILIYQPHRGKGYGRRTLELLETKLRNLGVTQFGLHVFAHNQVAVKLYKTRGFHTASFKMRKDI